MSTLNWPSGRSVKRSRCALISLRINLTVHENRRWTGRWFFCHGFPELAYSWRHQLPVVAGCGLFALSLPDQRGYADSSAPPAITDYGLTELTGDMAGMPRRVEDRPCDLRRTRLGRLRRVGRWPLLYPERTAGCRRRMHTVHGNPADFGFACDGQRQGRAHVHRVVSGTRPPRRA